MGKVVVTLAVTCTALALVCLHLVNRLREGEATIAELQAQVANLQADQQQREALTPAPSAAGIFEVIELAPQNAAAPAKTASSKEEPAPAPAQGTAVASAALPRPSREESIRMFREHRERQRQLMQDPEYREAMRLQTRTNLARQYPGVIEELGLDPQQAESFFTLLADQQLRMQEQMEPLWEVTPHDERTDPTTIQQRHHKIQQATSELQRNNEAELAALLGPQKMQAWKEYQSTVGQRWQLEQMNSTLAAQGMPLPDDLRKPMLKALAEVQRQEMQEISARSARIGPAATAPRLAAAMGFQTPDMEQFIEGMKKRNQRMLDAISPYLTYEQRQALEKEYEAQIQMQEAQMRLQRARGENSGTNALQGFFAPGAGVVEATAVHSQ
jgi:hypothetical protein